MVPVSTGCAIASLLFGTPELLTIFFLFLICFVPTLLTVLIFIYFRPQLNCKKWKFVLMTWGLACTVPMLVLCLARKM